MIRVIDIESTGTDPAIDAIIEIASADMVRGGGVTNAMATYVNPMRPIPPISSAVHHILDQDVEGAPKLHEAIERFKGASVNVAHNADFERSFFEAKEIDLDPWLCTYKCALRVFPDFESHSNQALRYLLGLATPFGIPRDQISPHRAASDVIVTAAILEELMKRAAWADLLAWSAEPALHTKFGFGKYRGQRYDAIAANDPSYLAWIIEKSDLDAGVKFSAQHALQQKVAA